MSQTRQSNTGRSNTSSAILGILSTGPMSGYDIKAFADRSVRPFWAVSYGQLYPELKALAAAGLVAAEAQPRGSRRRTVYRLTERGQAALANWLAEPIEGGHELRDEMLLKLFFGDPLSPSQLQSFLRQMRRRHEEAAANLTKQEARLGSRAGALRLAVSRFGSEYHRFRADWCTRLLAEIQGGARR